MIENDKIILINYRIERAFEIYKDAEIMFKINRILVL